MKAKYIFRGFGLGVIITAVIMGAYTRNAVADARVNVLKEYGIGEEAVLAETLVDVSQNDDNDTLKNEDDKNVEVVPFDEKTTAAENNAGEQNPVPVQTQAVPENVPDANGNGDTDGNGNTDADADGNSDTDVNGNGNADGENEQTPNSVIVVVPSDEREGGSGDNADDMITVVISQGDSSEVVARKLYSAGLVESAGEFNAFLIQHGYDKKMRAGTKSIEKDASWQEIADKISRN